jgi:SAM-dependent methyltransferase
VSSTTYSLTDQDSDSYEDGYSIFLRRSDFRARVIEKFSSLVSTAFPEKSELSVLDVGCGNGQMTLRYVSELKKIVSSLHLTLLEPAHESLEEALNLVKPSVDSIETNAKLPEQTKYDLIIASYVFYHLPPDTIASLVSQIKTGGVLAIMMGTNDHPLKSHPALKAVTAHGSSDKLTPFLDMIEKTQEFRITRHKFNTSLTLRGLWDEKNFSEEAKALLGFSLNKNFDELTASSLEAITEIFESAFKSSDGYLKPVHEIIWVERLQ